MKGEHELTRRNGGKTAGTGSPETAVSQRPPTAPDSTAARHPKSAAAPGKRTLLLHIGANKTGSSAIQKFLRSNARLLTSAGIAVAPSDLTPEGAVTGQHVPVIQTLRADLETGKTQMRARLRALSDALAPDSRILISAENLSNPGPESGHQLFAAAAQDYDLRVVFYIRRQDDLLLSSWQQWASKSSDDFWAWMLQSVGVIGDWRVSLMQWETIVPRENITVRIFDREKLAGGDVVTDFAHTLGVAHILPECLLETDDVNPSYSAGVVEFVKGNPQLFKDGHDQGIYRVIEILTGDAFHRNPRESILTLKQRRAVLARYVQSDAWVRKAYFPDMRTALFKQPNPTDYDFVGREEIEAQKWALVASLIYGLSKRMTRKSRRDRALGAGTDAEMEEGE